MAFTPSPLILSRLDSANEEPSFFMPLFYFSELAAKIFWLIAEDMVNIPRNL